MKSKSVIRVDDTWHACRLLEPTPLNTAATGGLREWVAPESHGSIELMVPVHLAVPPGCYALNLNGKKMTFHATRQKLERVWGDVTPSNPQNGY